MFFICYNFFRERRFFCITKIDYALKAHVLELGLPLVQKQVSQSLFFNRPDNQLSFTKYSYNVALDLENSLKCLYPTEWKESQRINHASVQRTLRLKKRIFNMIDYSLKHDGVNPLFLTLTFTDKTFSTTNAETRKRYVTRFLKENCISYVANKDYGAQKGREHYHAVVLVSGRLNYIKWSFGCLNGQKIVLNGVSNVKLAKYVSKLTNHAIKETCKRNVLIYSRS